MNKHEHLKHKIHNFVEKLSLFKAMQKIKEYEEKLIKKSCEACEHYSEEDCGNCSYPDYIFFEEEHYCSNCGYCTDDGFYNCSISICSEHRKWIPKNRKNEKHIEIEQRGKDKK